MNLREWALPVYTILMQIATGALTAQWIIYSILHFKYRRKDAERLNKVPLLIVLVTIATAMIGSHFHLSRPYFSFLSVINIRSSWLSREIVFTVLFFNAVALLGLMHWFNIGRHKLRIRLGWLAVLMGWANEYCLVRIYLLPTQIAWNTYTTIVLFYFSTVLLGAIASAAILIMDFKYAEIRNLAYTSVQAFVIREALRWIAVISVLMVGATIVGNYYQIIQFRGGGEITQISLELLLNLYPVLFGMRLFAIVAGVGLFVIAIHFQAHSSKPLGELIKPVYFAYLLVLIGEILDRFLFYATHVRTGV